MKRLLILTMVFMLLGPTALLRASISVEEYEARLKERAAPAAPSIYWDPSSKDTFRVYEEEGVWILTNFTEDQEILRIDEYGITIKKDKIEQLIETDRILYIIMKDWPREWIVDKTKVLCHCGYCKRLIEDYEKLANKADGSIICPLCFTENVN